MTTDFAFDGDESAAGGGAAPLRLDVLGPQGETLRSVTLPEGVLTVGAAGGNQLVLEGEGVGRYHLRLSLAGSELTVTDLGTRGGTQLNDQPLPPQMAIPVPAGATLRLGPFRLRLGQTQQKSQTATTTALPTENVSSDLSLAIADGRETLEITPGQMTVAVLTLSNRGDQDAQVRLAVEGVPEVWLNLPDAPVALPAGSIVNLTLQIQVPREAASRAGEYPLIIRARERGLGGQVCTVTARWTILPFAESHVDLRPRKRMVRGTATADYSLMLDNAGNQAESYTISVGEDEPALDYQLDHDRITLQPGGHAAIQLGVQARENPSGEQQTYNFTVQIRPLASPQPLVAAAQLGQQRPIARWVFPAILLALLALFGLGMLLWDLTRAGQAVATNGPQGGLTQEPTDALLGPTIGRSEINIEEALAGTQTAMAMLSQMDQQATEFAEQLAAVRTESNPTLEALAMALEEAQAVAAAAAAAAAEAATGGNSANGGGGSSNGGGGGSGDNGGAAAPAPAPAPPPPTPEPPSPTPTVTPTPSPTPSPSTSVIPSPTTTGTATATPTLVASSLRMRFSVPVVGGVRPTDKLPAFVIELIDVNGTRVTDIPGEVALRIADASVCTRANSVELKGLSSVRFIDGLATFQDIQIDCVGNNYVLQASTSSGPAAIRSEPFSIIEGLATHLAFAVTPNQTRAGEALKIQVANEPGPVLVRAVDEFGNSARVASGVAVSIDAASGPDGPGALAAGSVVSAPLDPTTRTASFSNLRLNRAGTYTLRAQSGQISNPAISNPFIVQANQLVFVPATPLSVVAAAPLEVRVAARDVTNQVDQTFALPLVLTLFDSSDQQVQQVQLSANAGEALFRFNAPARSGTYRITAEGAGYNVITRNLAVSANGLSFVNQPRTTRSGENLAVTDRPAGEIRIQATDAQGNDQQLTGMLTLELLGGPNEPQTGFRQVTNPAPPPSAPESPSPTPTGTQTPQVQFVRTLTVSMTNGLATIPNLRIDRAAQGYQLRASINGLTATSNAFQVTGNQLRLSGLQERYRAEQNLGTLTVEVLDSLGLPDRTRSGDVRLTLQQHGTAAAHLIRQGSTQPVSELLRPMSAGQLILSDLSINTLSQNQPYSFALSFDGLTATSTPFLVGANQLLLGTQPDNVRVGDTIVPMSIRATDSQGTLDTTFAEPVQITLLDSTLNNGLQGQLALNGTTALNFGGGTITANNLSVNRIGREYRLRATAAGLVVTSNPFNATANQLRFTTQPLPGPYIAGTDLIQVVVRASDAFGNGDATFTAPISIWLTDETPLVGTGSGGVEMEDTITINPTNGSASFSDLRIMDTGENYRFQASGGGFTTEPSSPFSVRSNVARRLDLGMPTHCLTTCPYPYIRYPDIRVLDEWDNVVEDWNYPLDAAVDPVIAVDASGIFSWLSDGQGFWYGYVVSSYLSDPITITIRLTTTDGVVTLEEEVTIPALPLP
ncbi:MAG: FHA domain-containing protein [Candidatus Viridilinea halotolerans]|uniref:FHA domain-containing protein n=1 Tax=Candidatus Viridilinea halotolerans TaxID=2491704 RepID=A0A426TSD4_9CHLR|nr:MAG: FHA domain-containing protein [Candidatus Viridilinea halotolerans]